jgi:hypothetical protein
MRLGAAAAIIAFLVLLGKGLRIAVTVSVRTDSHR